MNLMRINSNMQEQEQFKQSFLKNMARRRLASAIKKHIEKETLEQIIPRLDQESPQRPPSIKLDIEDEQVSN